MKKIYIALLIVIEVFVKVIIYNYYMNTKLLLLDWIGFSPFINRNQLSILNREFDLGISISVLIVMNIICITMAFFMYKYCIKKEVNRYFIYAMQFILVGSINSLIDKIVWRGSLDYLLLFSTLFDLKDMYLFIGVGLSFVGAVEDIKKMTVVKKTKNQRSI